VIYKQRFYGSSRLASSLWFSASTRSGKETRIYGTGFQWAGGSFYYPANSVKALKETHSTGPNQRKSHTGFIPSSSITGLIREWPLLRLCQLSDANTLTDTSTLQF